MFLPVLLWPNDIAPFVVPPGSGAAYANHRRGILAGRPVPGRKRGRECARTPPSGLGTI
jgi:hypothetical protein